MYVLKTVVLDVGLEPFTPQGEALGSEFPLIVGRCTRGGVYGEIMSHLILSASVWFSSHLPNV